MFWVQAIRHKEFINSTEIHFLKQLYEKHLCVYSGDALITQTSSSLFLCSWVIQFPVQNLLLDYLLNKFCLIRILSFGKFNILWSYCSQRKNSYFGRILWRENKLLLSQLHNSTLIVLPFKKNPISLRSIFFLLMIFFFWGCFDDFLRLTSRPLGKKINNQQDTIKLTEVVS